MSRSLLVLALVTLPSLVGCHPVDDLRARLALKAGNVHYLEGDFTTALTHYDRLLELVPGHARGRRNRGYCRLALLRAEADGPARRSLADAAIGDFVWLLERRDGRDDHVPSRARLREHVTSLLLDTGQVERAIDMLERVVDSDPDDASTMLLLGNLHADVGRFDEAIAWHERRRALAPERAESQYAFGVFAWRLVSDHPGASRAVLDATVERGLDAIERALASRPDYAEAHAFENLLYREKARLTARPDDRRRFLALADSALARAEALFARDPMDHASEDDDT